MRSPLTPADLRCPAPITGGEIAAVLGALGLRPGESLLVHSAMSRIGFVEGGAPALLAAFLDVLGPEGTLAAPTFPFTGSMLAYLQSEPVFDVQSTPSRMGALSEAVRTHPAAVRSAEPTHPVAAIGRLARYLTEDHVNSEGSCDEHSPLYRLRSAGGRILLLGVDFRVCTLLHTAEELARVPFIDFETRYPVRVRDRGAERVMSLYCHSTPLPANFPAIEPELAAAGLLTRGHVGQAECRLFAAADLLDVALDRLRRDPYFLRVRGQ
jgi:aminoglycoside 3-N-acetyltransferase